MFVKSSSLGLYTARRLAPLAMSLWSACELDYGAIPVGADDAAMTPDAASGAREDAGEVPVQHKTCSVMSKPTREEPEVDVDATGRPLFDGYRDVDCNEAAARVGLCPSRTDCPQETCLRRDEDSTGVCLSRLGTAVPTTLDDGRCVAYVAPLVLAAACCIELPGFDCRAWPYNQDSQPGELCARHRDCEPGLSCKVFPDLLVRVGVCVCPDVEPTPVDVAC